MLYWCMRSTADSCHENNTKFYKFDVVLKIIKARVLRMAAELVESPATICDREAARSIVELLNNRTVRSLVHETLHVILLEST